ncbi:MAG: hypothetical protein GKR98_16985 [Boseongicola sp.]|nr:MAG: hypothetical protein GKR98_16985 [Boseongicola sp.]
MTLTFNFLSLIEWPDLSKLRLPGRGHSGTSNGMDADCIHQRREFLNRMMCENAGAVEGEFGMQAMMSQFPREF